MNKNTGRVKDIFDLYKAKLSKIVKEGTYKEIAHSLNDSQFATLESNKTMNDYLISSSKGLDPDALYINHVDFCLSLLTSEERIILFNDFVVNKDDLWYTHKWSRSTFYRIRSNAIDKFVRYYGKKGR